MTKFKALIGVAALALAGAASATDSTIGDLSNKSSAIGATHAAGESFIDTYTFTVGGLGLMNGVVFSLPFDIEQLPGVEFNVALGAIALQKSNGDVVAFDNTPADGLVLGAPLAAGTYKFIVGGVATGTLGGSYAGVVNAIAAVPEPETYALMLAGLAAIGFKARRRRPN